MRDTWTTLMLWARDALARDVEGHVHAVAAYERLMVEEGEALDIEPLRVRLWTLRRLAAAVRAELADLEREAWWRTGADDEDDDEDAE